MKTHESTKTSSIQSEAYDGAVAKNPKRASLGSVCVARSQALTSDTLNPLRQSPDKLACVFISNDRQAHADMVAAKTNAGEVSRISSRVMPR